MPARIWPSSDLHFPHHRGGATAFFGSFTPPDVGSYDAAVVAGDIDNPVMNGIEHVARNYVRGGKPCIYQPGNHDGYRGLAGKRFEFTFWEEQMQMLEEFGAQNGILIGNRRTHIIGDVRYVCIVGWPEFAPELVPHGMSLNDAKSFSSKGWSFDNPFDRTTPHNDFREIRSGRGNNRHNLTPSKMIEWSKLDSAFLRGELAKPFDGETVVVSHVGPASLVTAGMMSWLYGSRVNEDAICNPTSGVACWISGHTHKTLDLDSGGVRMISNARGYQGENHDFDPKLIVEVGMDLTPRMGV